MRQELFQIYFPLGEINNMVSDISEDKLESMEEVTVSLQVSDVYSVTKNHTMHRMIGVVRENKLTNITCPLSDLSDQATTDDCTIRQKDRPPRSPGFYRFLSNMFHGFHDDGNDDFAEENLY
jgi:hypothetical protein